MRDGGLRQTGPLHWRQKSDFAAPGATLPGVYQLRTVAECEAIRQAAKPGARAVVVGMGFIGSEVAASLRQMGLDNEIRVNARCQTSVPDVFAAGDVANLLHPIFGRVRVEHFNNAEKQGRAVARAVLGTLQVYEYIYSFWPDQYEHKLEYVGFARSWERMGLRGSYDSSKFLAFYLTQSILQAACRLNRGGDPELDADAELRVPGSDPWAHPTLGSRPGGRPDGPADIEPGSAMNAVLPYKLVATDGSVGHVHHTQTPVWDVGHLSQTGQRWNSLKERGRVSLPNRFL